MVIYDLSKATRIGAGGSKTAYLVEDEIVVMTPNSLEGEWLVNRWSGIVSDEMLFTNKYTEIGIPVLALTPCEAYYHGKVLLTYCSRSFASYTRDGIYILDLKDGNSSQWPRGTSIVTENTVATWVPVLKPMLRDMFKLIDHQIPIATDSGNLAIVGKNSSLHSGSDLPYEIRLWGFDFSSKRHRVSLTSFNALSWAQVFDHIFTEIRCFFGLSEELISEIIDTIGNQKTWT